MFVNPLLPSIVACISFICPVTFDTKIPKNIVNHQNGNACSIQEISKSFSLPLLGETEIGFALPEAKAMTITTKSIAPKSDYADRSFLIATPHEKQELPLSCEASSITQLYNFARLKEGRYLVEEAFIRSKIPTYSGSIVRHSQGKLLWGDPDWYFVGDIYGRQSSSPSRMTGYGIHIRGIERRTKHLFDRLGYTLARVDRSDSVILESLSNGYPLMAYYISTPYTAGAPYSLDWQTPGGRYIRGYIGEHTALIVGANTNALGDIVSLTLTEGRSSEPVVMQKAEWDERSQWFSEYLTLTKKQNTLD